MPYPQFAVSRLWLSLIDLIVRCHQDPLKLVVVPDHKTVPGNHEHEADNSNRPRYERPQDDNDSYLRQLAERPRIPERAHEPCNDRVRLAAGPRQHVIRAKHIERFQAGRGDREDRDNDVCHYGALSLKAGGGFQAKT
jgi:hypothetical protein